MLITDNTCLSLMTFKRLRILPRAPGNVGIFKCFLPSNRRLKTHFYSKEPQSTASIPGTQEVVIDLSPAHPHAVLSTKPNGNSFPFLLINIPLLLIGFFRVYQQTLPTRSCFLCNHTPSLPSYIGCLIRSINECWVRV